MLNEYHCITRRRAACTVQRVSEALIYAEGFPFSGGPSTSLSRNSIPTTNATWQMCTDVHPRLAPCTLQGGSRLTNSRKPYGYSLEPFEDFTGRVIRTFEQDGSPVNIPCDEHIRAEKPLLHYLSFLFKPVFSANHRGPWQQTKRVGAPRGESSRYCLAKQ